ncbi:LiaI-LiaF-like domain-containing protein [Parabacteroides sp. FAFU027]|uniref:LiaI-LiaF-like domain-containing protein n=1 Tax=Parabacteroides sp. FAFU027 TaxID=2922715 RepID=UPI001FAFEBDC|nr:DUF5668 domain-containing protein [Parabacteroides sp. FAFU027]
MESQFRNEDPAPYGRFCAPPRHRHCVGSKVFFGVVVIVAGLLLLGFNTGLLNESYRPVIFSWPMLLVVIGVTQMFNRSIFGGTILTLIGGFFLMRKLGYIDPQIANLYWPVLIIAAGVVIILKTSFGPKRDPFHKLDSGYTGSEIKNGVIEENNIFSGSKRKFQDMVFRGGEINCIFGGSELDLTHAKLEEGINQLEVNCIFGGITLIVPSDWNVQLKKDSIFGDFADKRPYSEAQKDNTRILIVKASCIFGGGEIKSYV